VKSVQKARQRGTSRAIRKPADMARPLIVFGMGRSGTRMCANLLNNSRDVELQGEIGGPVGSKMMAWLYNVRVDKKAPDSERIYRLARAAFRDSTSSSCRIRNQARWFGHKTPRHERHFDRYEAIFDDPDRPAHYVYCLRNPFHVWRSYRVMPWNKFKTVRSFLDAWILSVQTYERMIEAAPGRVTLFNLDEMVRAPDRLAWIEPNLLAPLGISPDSFRRFVDDLENTNSASNKLGQKPSELPQSDLAEIASDREAARMIRTYFPWMEEELAAYEGQAPLHKRLFRFRAT
jgi:hypothetical protein